MTPSAHQVLLHIFDCLEMILLDLPAATLLACAQRVCKAWHNTIATSPRLQRKIFLSPSSGREGRSRTPNPLLATSFPRFFTTSLYDHAGPDEVLESLGVPGEVQGILQRPKQEQPPLLRTGASWRRMFPEYPITFKLGLIEARVMVDLVSYHSGILDVPYGVTMGKLFDTVYTMFLGRDTFADRFCIYWRDKTRDPRVTPSSYIYGKEEIALSTFPSDVTIVIFTHIYDGDLALLPESKADLNPQYMPADFDLSLVDLQLAFSRFEYPFE
ncbi:uncharacterized protein DNG_08957 [Cephalotrichum gorgonifer]|uniref:F-box domain-containing protein n=1 Tax=Cephalotrichum gorgonifer TaxID=2041049 RepID=A0AAE8SZ04_9PEZI|nr:uncharacterized protein DNG_08957 [Cephalotrichum gorgonifer]